jgi:outer membrane protein assembly factor BamD (BamD/ComL family)
VKRVFLALLVLSACQSDEKSAKPAAAPAAAPSDDKLYAEDIQKLCDSLALSGADKLEKLERVAPHSKWLGENLKTRAAQQFLVSTQPLKGEAKASALEAEAKRVGLSGCALATEFRG